MHSDSSEKDVTKAIYMEDEFDMAYKAIMSAPLGWAIMKIKKDEDTYSYNEEYATMLETDGAARDIEHRSSEWKKQQPIITVAVTLALGFKKK